MLPRILVIGLNLNPVDLIQEITGKNSPDSAQACDLLSVSHENFLWPISNKYYSCTVRLTPLKIDLNNEISSATFEKVEALIIYFSSSDLQQYLVLISKFIVTYAELYDTEVKLIVCKKDQNVSYNDLQQWIISCQYELIEIETKDKEAPKESMEEDDTFNETFGINRVIEALQVNFWSNAEPVKVHPNPPIDPEPDLCRGAASNSTEPTDGNEHQVDEFCDLYSKLNLMREGVANLPREHRLQRAEQFVTSFWNALGPEANDHLDELSE